ncbi:leucyl aminopeptidase [Candidatus Microgenomates bacterium]|nr:MAG: leucyl aminopeptidase [Candidatus Microgenomates bacterium]
MNFEITDNHLNKISADAILVFAFENGKLPAFTQAFLEVDKALEGFLFEALKFEDFKAKEGSLFSFNSQKKILANKVFVLGLGKKEDFSQNILRNVIAGFTKKLRSKISSVALPVLEQNGTNLDVSSQSQVITEGFILGSYAFNKYKKNSSNKNLETIIISAPSKNIQLKVKEGMEKGKIYSKATILTRNLVNEPSSVITPTALAQVAQDIAKKNPDVKCTIYNKSELEKMGMAAFLGIAQGAESTAPKFIFLEYTPKGDNTKKKKVALVGKGITFDSGGISVKMGDSMKTMKIDMAGAATVLGVFSVISEIKPLVPVIGVIAATPNLISSKSIVPGDVVKAYNGKTIEILNTDAEGRVTLADSLYYAVKKDATEIIDLATLTGACEVALGTEIAGLFGNNELLKNKLKEAASSAGEKVWELPLPKEYKDLNRSDVADISNIPCSRYGGAITAALFLEEFVDNKPWVHLDIAGPAYLEKSNELGPKGATGFGVRMLINYLKGI